MPDLKDFEQFKDVLINLSGEPAWRAQKGEAVSADYMNGFEKLKDGVSSEPDSKSANPDELEPTKDDSNILQRDGLPRDSSSVSDGMFDVPNDFSVPDFTPETDNANKNDLPDFSQDGVFDTPDTLEESQKSDTPEPSRSSIEIANPQVDPISSDIIDLAPTGEPVRSSDTTMEELDDLELPDIDSLVSTSSRSDDFDFSFEKSSSDADYYAELEQDIAPAPLDMTMQELSAAVRGETGSTSAGHEGTDGEGDKVSDSFDLTDFGDALEKVDKKEGPKILSGKLQKDSSENKGDLYFRKYDLDRMEHTLAGLPRNLKIAVEEILASPETPILAIRQMTDKLMNGASARSIADEVRSISGRTIIVPLFYQRGTGENLEKRKRGFAYVFATQAWPVLKKISLTMLITAVALLAIFHLLYRPGMADYYYNSGYKQLLKGNYDKAEEAFNTAFNGWKLGFINVRGVRKQKWFYKYADAYSEQREFSRAVQKYEDLLQNYPNSKKAYMAYADFEGSVHARYAEADRIYKRYLTNIDPSDADVLLAAGDNLFEWGTIEPEKTELARQVYADLQFKLGRVTPTLGIRFLRYAIRVDNVTEIERWSRYFLTYMPKKRGFKVEPVTFAELAGWYLDNNQPGVAREVLDLAIEKDPDNPYVLYQMARYYSDGGLSRVQEEQMLQRAYYALMQYRSLTWQQTDMLVDVYRRLGLLYMMENKNTESEENFQKSISTYEEAVRGKVLVPKEKYGKIYKEFADLYYDKNFDYDSALIYMNKALSNFYDTPELRYKLGYVYFLKKDFNDALENFYLSFENAQDNVNVLFGYATTLAERGSYSSAEGVYDQLRISLERRNSADASTDPAMTPQQKRRIVDMLAKTYNNLGVVRYQLSQASREVSHYRTLAETNLGQAVIYWDQLTRDPESGVRVKERGLPQTNFRAITYPAARLELGLFTDLPTQFPFGEPQPNVRSGQS